MSRKATARRGPPGLVAGSPGRRLSGCAPWSARHGMPRGPSVRRPARGAGRVLGFRGLAHVGVVAATRAAVTPGDLVRLLVSEAVVRLGVAPVRVRVASMRAPLRGPCVSTGRAAAGASGRGCGLGVCGGVALRCRRGLAVTRRRVRVDGNGRRGTGSRRRRHADGVDGPGRRRRKCGAKQCCHRCERANRPSPCRVRRPLALYAQTPRRHCDESSHRGRPASIEYSSMFEGIP